MKIAEALEAGGLVARRLPGFEVRSEQIEMASAVERAFRAGRHLLVEAGTGVGKSFAYLLPAIGQATRDHQRVVISTHTIALQEQLLNKDIPFLNAIIPAEFSAVLVKGRSNYLDLRRLEYASKRQASLFSSDEQLQELWRIEDWAYKTSDGSLSDLSPQPSAAVWDRVRSEQGNCMGRRCRYYRKCFYQRARRRAQNADLLVVNHALFFSDLELRSSGVGILPDYDLVVLDEAHTIESVASEHFGLSISDAQVRFLLMGLFNEATGRGLLAMRGGQRAIGAVREARKAAERFFGDLLAWQREHGRPNGRITEPEPVPNPLSPALKALCRRLREVRGRLTGEEERFELNSYMERALWLAEALEAFMQQQNGDYVHWLEVGRSRQRRLTLSAAPVHVGSVLRQRLFEQVPSVVLTSATLCTRSGDGFDFLRERLGIDRADCLQLGSPFDYRRQVTLYVEAALPDPSETRRFVAQAGRAVEKYIRMTGGRAFVLFTSYEMMNEMADRMAGFFESEGINLMVQGRGLPRSLMLERFRKELPSVIFGTDSFWQGVDVAGEALSNVIIVKLPFAVPDRPIVEARRAARTSPTASKPVGGRIGPRLGEGAARGESIREHVHEQADGVRDVQPAAVVPIRRVGTGDRPAGEEVVQKRDRVVQQDEAIARHVPAQEYGVIGEGRRPAAARREDLQGGRPLFVGWGEETDPILRRRHDLGRPSLDPDLDLVLGIESAPFQTDLAPGRRDGLRDDAIDADLEDRRPCIDPRGVGSVRPRGPTQLPVAAMDGGVRRDLPLPFLEAPVSLQALLVPPKDLASIPVDLLLAARDAPKAHLVDRPAEVMRAIVGADRDMDRGTVRDGALR
ncbi:MAG: ATP-dependent DNA helicase, partial [Phycisphaerae bacterium]